MIMFWEKADSVIIPNFHFYWKHPIVNKYITTPGGYAPSDQFEGILILRKNKKPLWVSHPFNVKQAREIIRGAVIRTYSDKKELQKIIKANCGKRIGFDARHLAVSTLASFKKISKGKKFVNVSRELEATREVKSQDEIEKISKAVKETRRVLEKVKAQMHPGITEKNTDILISDEFKKAGLDTAFCIVAFGKNTANIHHVSGSKTLERESPVLIDCGAKYKGYCADLTISFWFGKNEPKKYSETMKKILDVLAQAEGKMKAGMKAKSLFMLTKPLGKMQHAFGHGLGLDVHDSPSGIGENSNWRLKKNMVLAIEPAVYTKEFGIRVENTYVVLNKGSRRL